MVIITSDSTRGDNESESSLERKQNEDRKGKVFWIYVLDPKCYKSNLCRQGQSICQHPLYGNRKTKVEGMVVDFSILNLGR